MCVSNNTLKSSFICFSSFGLYQKKNFCVSFICHFTLLCLGALNYMQKRNPALYESLDSHLWLIPLVNLGCCREEATSCYLSSSTSLITPLSVSADTFSAFSSSSFMLIGTVPSTPSFPTIAGILRATSDMP